MHLLDALELAGERLGRLVRAAPPPPSFSRGPDVIQGPVPVSQITSDDLLNENAVLLGESTPRPLFRKHHLIQQRQTVIPVQNQRLASESECFPERLNLLSEYPVLVVQIRDVGHDEMQFNLLAARFFGL